MTGKAAEQRPRKGKEYASVPSAAFSESSIKRHPADVSDMNFMEE